MRGAREHLVLQFSSKILSLQFSSLLFLSHLSFLKAKPFGSSPQNFHWASSVSPSVTVFLPGSPSDSVSPDVQASGCRYPSTPLLTSTACLCLFQAGTSTSRQKLVPGLLHRPFQSVVTWMVKTLFLLGTTQISFLHLKSCPSHSLSAPNSIRHSSLDSFNRKHSRLHQKRLIFSAPLL